MDRLAAALEAEGWTTLALPAGEAVAKPLTGRHSHRSTADAPTSPSDPGSADESTDPGGTDQFGFTYVVSKSGAERFDELFVPEGFPKTAVYQATTATHLYLLTVAKDLETSVAILIAGVFDRASLTGCERVANERGVMYTHVQKIDGTHLGSFAHDDPSPFFPATNTSR